MKILFFTGSRSEWGYIKPIIKLCKDQNIKYNICATNTHVLGSYGLSVNEIKKDGFKVSDEIYMTLDGYNTYSSTKSLGVIMMSFLDIVQRTKPDWILLAGDRGETLIAAIVAAYTNTPLAHIQAGELSGNIDGQARHAIGKFAHIHFASNKDAANRLKKLGEQSFRIKTVGAPQLDDIRENFDKLNDINKLLKSYSLEKIRNYSLIIFHPVVEEYLETKKIFENFIKCIKKTKYEKRFWISPNSDAGSHFIKDIFLNERNTDDILFDNLPRNQFLTLMKNASAIIGNSSAGIIESPSFKIPTINIGRRQKNRLKAKNVINIENYTEKKLMSAIKKIESKNFKKKIQNIKNPYGSGNSSEKILEILKKTKIDENLLQKELTY
jgi:GDP/UDP-N,N'-diacetylbacillosamine 2-epimerase (hydrolysing)